MSVDEVEPIEAEAAEENAVAPQATHLASTQTVTHEYLTQSGKVMRETIKTNQTVTAVLDFIYDESGKPFAMIDQLSAQPNTYYYVLNLQGDVVKLVTDSGAVAASYEYDAWGNILSQSGSMAEKNPLRYRGYYYDSETGFYYLQSRYYDPATRRFINADALASTGQGLLGTNMFAYCMNNPVYYADPSGRTSIFEWLYDIWNKAEDSIWKLGAKILKRKGYKLTGELLNLAASGAGNKYYASEDSDVSKEIANNAEFVASVMDNYRSNSAKGSNQNQYNIYEFPVSQGDLGAALHNVSYSYEVKSDKHTNREYLLITITDVFDFTEYKNPLTQDGLKAKFLWLMNDIACVDSDWGLLDPVDVEIKVVISLD